MSGGQPSVSVALATRDGEAHVSEMLLSLRRQSRPPDELVVYDDASLDGTVELVERFAAGVSWPVTIRRASSALGVRSAFESAIAACTGDVVVLADQDDRWRPGRLEVGTRPFVDPEVRMTVAAATLIDDEGRARRGRLWRELGVSRRQRRRLAAHPPGPALRHSVAPGCVLAVRRTAAQVAVPFPGELSDPSHPMLHDRWLSLVAGCLGTVVVIEQPLVEYRMHSGQHVSAARVSPGAELRRQLGTPPVSSAARLAQLDVLGDHVEGRASLEAMAEVTRARAFLTERAELPATRLRRVRPVCRHLAAGSYRRFSSGAAAAAVDVLRPGGTPG